MKLRTASLLLPALLIAACSGLREDGFQIARENQETQQLTVTAAQDALVTTLKLEDQRSTGGGGLQLLLVHDSPDVRARAATALGRMSLAQHGEEVTSALVRALGDKSAKVRAAVAFALGMRADAECAEALLAHWRDADAGVRACIVEAASKIDDDRLHEEILFAFSDEALEVRSEAAIAPHRWPTAAVNAGEVDSTLIHVASKVAFLQTEAGDSVDPFTDAGTEAYEVRWRALFSLQRRGSQRAAELFQAYAASGSGSEARLYAVKGLGKVTPTDEGRRALEGVLGDPDWRIVQEALLALGRYAMPASLNAIEPALAHPSFHVRTAAFGALRAFPDENQRTLTLLEKARVDRSATVRAAALVSEACLRGPAIVPTLELRIIDRDPILRAAVAEASDFLPDLLAIDLLERLARDKNTRVAGMAVEALGRHLEGGSREQLHEFLNHRDNGLKLAAILALGPQPEGTPARAKEEDVPFLRAAFRGAQGDIGQEVRFNALRNLGAIGTADALEIVRAALDDPAVHVRSVAHEVLSEHGKESAPSAAKVAIRTQLESLPEYGASRIVEVSTNRGLMTFELFPEEAPLHVHNFLTLADKNHYDGLTFHRVVSDFVIQGGCYRGDGNGGTTWRGDEALRHEITPRKYKRGSLGMPRNEDWESGGSQIFVTHRDTPHLDGRYTIFGELRSGLEVLDSIEVGDVILDVRRR
jgi:cyclophilin family peptidyl-prolyl cis-trans isomerase/HEAT repeat protein